MKQYNFKINGHEYAVEINSIADGRASVTVNGTAYEVDLPEGTAAPVQAPTAVPVANQAPAQASAAAPAPGNAPVASGDALIIKSPMPGTIIDVCVKPGDSISRGAKVAVLESMKMENDILAEKDGVIKDVFVSKGDQLSDGDKIVSIA
ncbi:MAG: acetyl-CoA carboxylase biotin carboxyl carrier protein subunit [Bacteroidales bacterium]|nr:acetyl-CoA carboxylase biotin carboxyl carrier protein subunit [Bacteroidales bacterium]